MKFRKKKNSNVASFRARFLVRLRDAEPNVSDAGVAADMLSEQHTHSYTRWRPVNMAVIT